MIPWVCLAAFFHLSCPVVFCFSFCVKCDHRRIIKGPKGDYGRGLWLEVGDVIRLRCLSEGLARRREMNFICRRQLFRRFAETDAAAQRIKFKVWFGFLSGCKGGYLQAYLPMGNTPDGLYCCRGSWSCRADPIICVRHNRWFAHRRAGTSASAST